MSTIGQRERATQERVIALFRDTLKYRYLGNWHHRQNNSNIEASLLRAFLRKQGHNEILIGKALFELDKVAGDQTRSLYDTNKEVYTLLRYGIQVKADVGDKKETVKLINWEEPLTNDFAIAEEVTIKGERDKRPDIVIYVNGIALGVLELKRSMVSVSEGIRQNLLNQEKNLIQSFFKTMQLVMAGNDTEGLRYGTIETTEKYYHTWKEESTVENLLDRHLLQLCDKKRFLEIIHDFIVFDSGIKKLCRPNQYFGVRAAQQRVRSREGGIIWHSQGSGKSLTMVWLAKWIREHVTDARVLIITDRTELDEQIEKVFRGVQEEIYRTKSGKDLITQLNAGLPWLLCSLIHKFVGSDESNVEGFIKELTSSLPANFKAKGDLYVFVDECHRTQSGKLHDAMKLILPNAMFIGFTGTPLLKADKQTSIEIFGKYIHTYKFDEAVTDKVVLDLRYEARDIDQHLTSPKKIDQWFEAKTKGLNDIALSRLKQKWGTIQKVYSSHSRLEQIVADIMLDMETRPRLMSGRGNAMLVSDSIYQACQFYELFQVAGLKCAIVTSYKPSKNDIKDEQTSGEGLTEKLKQYTIYTKMLNGKSPEAFEQEVKEKFINEPGQMKLLIVVDKLLTGFDAPSASYLYIDKKMQDHGLFQAICRVNRLDDEEKDYGYIVDYKDLFKSLAGSIHDYTAGALEAYEKKDVKGLLSDRIDEGRRRLEDARETIKALCEPVAPPKDTPDYMRYFCAKDSGNPSQLKDNEPKRVLFYRLTNSLIRAFANLANELPEARYSAKESVQLKEEVKYYESVCKEIGIASGDHKDLKIYEPAMRHLIDTYIRADDTRTLSTFEDLSILQLIAQQGLAALNVLPKELRENRQTMAETIENNLRKVIIDEHPINPIYYDKMSQLLDTLIQERQDQALDYERYLAEIVRLVEQVQNPGSGSSYPTDINTPAKRALYEKFADYGTIDNSEKLAKEVDDAIRRTKKDSWKGNPLKEREIYFAILRQVGEDEPLANAIFEIVKNQNEY